MRTRAFLPGQLRLILAITLVYVVAWFAYYSQLPAGQIPTEEAQATLDAARAMAQGSSTESDGHSLYTYILSFCARFFETEQGLTACARGLNAIALILAAGYAASAAGHYWRRNRAVWISGLCVGLNPVMVFWAGEITPILWASACISISLWRIYHWLRAPQYMDSLWIGATLTLAAAFETTLLPVALLWPLLAFAYPQHERVPHLALGAALPVLGAVLCLLTGLSLQDPWQWEWTHLGGDLYRALGSREIFDEKNYSLYRQLHLILFVNPIHWAALFVMAGAGMYVRLKDGHSGRNVLLGLSVLGLFALSFALINGGGQARASLVPLLAVFAGGITQLKKIWGHASQRTRRKITVGALALVLFAYAGHLFQDAPADNWEPDYVYLAQANIKSGNNDRATTWAEKALELNPLRNDMQEVIVLAQFNEWATGNQTRSLPIELAREYLQSAQQVEGTPTTLAIQGIYHYKLRETETATRLWRSQSMQSPLAQLCLYWTGETFEPAPRTSEQDSPYARLLDEAQKINRSALEYSSTEKLLDNMLAFAY